MLPVEILRKLRNRPPQTHKYDYGHVLIIGGAPGMVGAPLLAAEAALRSGAGLVTIASQADVVDKLEKRVREAMTLRLPPAVPAAADSIAEFADRRKVTTVVIGPGLSPAFTALAPALLSKINTLPVVIDGGAIGAFHDDLNKLAQAGRRQPIILTPHAGEFRKLTGKTPPQERGPLKREVSEFAGGHSLTLVFKGHHSLVAHPDGTLYENSSGNPGLATAGTGDVLSGIIAGLIAQLPEDIPGAVEAAVYLHGLAGDLAARAKTQTSLIASDVIDYLPTAIKHEAEVL